MMRRDHKTSRKRDTYIMRETIKRSRERDIKREKERETSGERHQESDIKRETSRERDIKRDENPGEEILQLNSICNLL